MSADDRARLRVLHVIIGLETGGAELMLKRLVLEQRRTGLIEPIVVSLTEMGAIGSQLMDSGIEVRALGLEGMRNVLAVIGRLTRLIRTVRPDVVQSWMYHADLIGGVSGWLAGNRYIVWGIRNTDLFPGAGVSRSLLWIMRLCAHLSASIPCRIVCVAESARNSHRDFGYAADKLHVIPNGYLDVSPAGAEARRRARRVLGLPDDVIVVGTVGRFNEYKDHRNFVRAMGLVAAASGDDVVFLMVGRDVDPTNHELEGWIAQTGHPARFHLLGEQSDVASCFAAMDIFCLHSKSEGFPNVLAEAMLAGIPSVTTDVGDARLLGDSTVTVIAPENPIALAEAISALMRLPPDERAAMGQSGRDRIRAHYLLSAVCEQYLELYRSCGAVRGDRAIV